MGLAARPPATARRRWDRSDEHGSGPPIKPGSSPAPTRQDEGLPVASLRSQLLLDRGKIDPSALPADQAVAKVEDVQEAGLDGAASPAPTGWGAPRGGGEDPLIRHL